MPNADTARLARQRRRHRKSELVDLARRLIDRFGLEPVQKLAETGDVSVLKRG